MTKKVRLDRLRELAKHRWMREPVFTQDNAAPPIHLHPEPDILIWPIPRPDSFLPD